MVPDDPFLALRDLLRDLDHTQPPDDPHTPSTPPRTPDAPGTWIGSYRLLGTLGEGGMGVVHRAYDTKRNQTVALKTLQRIDPSTLHRFKNEFRSLADLSHRNLVTLFELLCDNDRWCFTMELVDGTTFDRHLAASGSLDATGHDARVRDVFRQLAEGLAVLHASSKLHRDIKPSNTLVTHDGRVVLVDFGLAADLDASGIYESTEHRLVGTIAYMSPEQSAGGPITPASDWYSVGVMLFEALTGHLPFSGSKAEVLKAKARGELSIAMPLDQRSGELMRLALDLLRRDPARRPSSHEVLARLGSGALHPRSARTPDIPFIGRDTELAALREAYQTMRNGRATIAFVHGSSGAGKTALVNHFIDELAEDPRVLVLSGRCYEQESVPFKALDSLIDRLTEHLRRLRLIEVQALLPRDVRTLARVFPVLQQVKAVADAPVAGTEAADPQELRRRAGVALRELLARLGDRRTLVLAIDDLQWGDVDSASLLMDILTPPDAPLFLGIGCYRTEDAVNSPFFKRLRQSRSGSVAAHNEREVVVGALGTKDAEQLTISLLNILNKGDAALTESIVRESAGQPYLVYELVEHVKARADGVDLGNALNLTDVIWRRIQQLPEEARRLLDIIAIAGKPIDSALARHAAGLIADDRALLPALRAMRLIRRVRTPGGDAIEAYHDRVRECVRDHLTTQAAQEHHLRLAEALAAINDADCQTLAFHFDRAGEPERAAAYYARAASNASQALAFDHSAALYARALVLRHWPAEERLRLRTGLGDALANAGRGARAASQYQLAAADADPTTAIELRRRAALQLLTSGHVDEGLEHLAPVLASVGTRLATAPWRALASLLTHRAQLRVRGIGFVERSEANASPEALRRIDIVWSAVVGLSVIDPIRAADFQTQGLLLALSTGEPFRIARALAVEAGHLASSGSVERAAVVVGEAERLAVRLGHPYALGMVELARGTVHYFAERWLEALHFSKKAEALFRERCTGVAWETATASAFTLWSLAKMGDVAELRRICPALLKEARERGDLYSITNLTTQIMTMVRLSADQPEDARAEVDSVMRRWSQNGYHVQHHDALLAHVPLELYCGQPAAAWERVRREWSAFRWSLLSQVQDVRVEMLQMRAYAALGMAVCSRDNEAFRSSAAADARRLRREQLPWTAALADYVEGAVSALGGDKLTAARHLTRAVSGFDAVNASLYAAATRKQLASLIDGRDAGHHQSAADAWFRSQGIQDNRRMTAAYAPGFGEVEVRR